MSEMRLLLSRLKRDERGSPMVELVFALPIFLILVVGGVELGKIIYTYHVLSDGTRAAARYLARIPNPCDASTAASFVSTRTRDWSGTPQMTGWPANNGQVGIASGFVVTVTGAGCGTSLATDPLTVTAQAEYQSATGLMDLVQLQEGIWLSGRNQQPRIAD